MRYGLYRLHYNMNKVFKCINMAHTFDSGANLLQVRTFKRYSLNVSVECNGFFNCISVVK